MRVLGEDQLQFQLLHGAAAGPACSQGGCPSSLKTRMMTRMTRMRRAGPVERLRGVAGVVEAVVGRPG